MTDKELMQQALDALEEINKLSIGENAICLPAEIDGALDALRERLEQPEQDYTITQTGVGIGQRAEEAYEAAKQRGWMGVSDYRLMAQPEQEPVAQVGMYSEVKALKPLPVGTHLYTTPPQGIYYTPPQRKPLTDEEIEKILVPLMQDGMRISMRDFARAIEAAHGIKGEA